MPIKAMLTDLEGVDEALHPLYVEQDIAGKKAFVLQIEGIDAHPTVRGLKTAHEARKDRLTKAEATVADLQARFADLPDDFDADAYAALVARAEKGTKAPDPAELERLIGDRVTRATSKVQAELKAATDRADRLQAQRDAGALDRVLTEQLAAVGVTEPAYIKAARALLRSEMRVEEDDQGSIVVLARDPDLDTSVPAAERIKAWADSEEGKTFVGPRGNSGGGASGGGGGGNGGARNNPYKAGPTWNMTEQTRLESSDPALAKRLRIEAGVKD